MNYQGRFFFPVSMKVQPRLVVLDLDAARDKLIADLARRGKLRLDDEPKAAASKRSHKKKTALIKSTVQKKKRGS